MNSGPGQVPHPLWKIQYKALNLFSNLQLKTENTQKIQIGKRIANLQVKSVHVGYRDQAFQDNGYSTQKFPPTKIYIQTAKQLIGLGQVGT